MDIVPDHPSDVLQFSTREDLQAVEVSRTRESNVELSVSEDIVGEDHSHSLERLALCLIENVFYLGIRKSQTLFIVRQ